MKANHCNKGSMRGQGKQLTFIAMMVNESANLNHFANEYFQLSKFELREVKGDFSNQLKSLHEQMNLPLKEVLKYYLSDYLFFIVIP